MQKLNILNKKQIKSIYKSIEAQWNAKVCLDYAFLTNIDGKIFLMATEIDKINLERLRINSLGLYFGVISKGQLRLSIDGSQIIGPKASKNIFELNNEQLRQWLKGEEITVNQAYEIHANKDKTFLIIKHDNDFYGCGKLKENHLINYMPKARRTTNPV